VIRSVKIINGGYTARVRGAGVLARVNVFDRASVHVRYIGIQGPAGAASTGIEFPFPSANTTWTVNHNLGVRPACAVFTPGGVQMWADVQHVSVNQLTVGFNTPQSGFVRLT
jgi:hypothetical protein